VGLLLILLCGFSPARADVLQAIRNEVDFVFSEHIDFELTAQVPGPIREVVLFYGQADERIVRRIYPAFEQGDLLRVRYREQLESGQFAPGTLMHHWWQVELEDGTIAVTPKDTWLYTDTNHLWQQASEGWIQVYWYGRSQPLAKRLLSHAQETLQRLSDEVGVTIQRPIRIYVYNSTADMRRALAPRSQTFDARTVTLGLAAGQDTLLLLGTDQDVKATLSHELSHIVVGLATDNPYTDLPRWLDEGLAMYAEGEMPYKNATALQQAIAEDKLLSIRSMSSYTGQASEVDLYYGQAYSIVAFLLETYGRDKMHELLNVFGQGALQEQALQQVYGFGLDELETAWRQSLGLAPRGVVAKPTALPTPEATPSLLERILNLLNIKQPHPALAP